MSNIFLIDVPVIQKVAEDKQNEGINKTKNNGMQKVKQNIGI